MAGAAFFAMSVRPGFSREVFINNIFWGGVYTQAHATSFSGVAVSGGDGFMAQSLPGLFRPNFELATRGFYGSQGMAYCGGFKEPVVHECHAGPFSLALVGKLDNRDALLAKLRRLGFVSDHEGDAGLLAGMFLQEESPEAGIERIMQESKGSFAAAIMIPGCGIYAFRSPLGRWPLAIGEKEGAAAVAFDTCGFASLGLVTTKDLAPGEVVLLKDGEVHPKGIITLPGVDGRVCIFLFVYYLVPSAVVMGVSISEARKRLGMALAASDIADGFFPDIVSYIPRSGYMAGCGYYEKFAASVRNGTLPYELLPSFIPLFVKHDHSYRSFLLGVLDRHGEARRKLAPVAETFDGKKAAVLEDSVVRGTMSVQIAEDIVPPLCLLGYHLRSSCAIIRRPCPHGNTTKRGELLVDRIQEVSEKGIASFLGVDTARFNSPHVMLEAIGLAPEHVCIECIASRLP